MANKKVSLIKTALNLGLERRLHWREFFW